MSDSSTPRLGAIYPDDAWVDVETQAYVNEFRAFLPSTVEMISAATPVLPRDATVESAVEMAESGHIEEAARRLPRHEAVCFAYYCTTIGFVCGPGADLDICRRITEATGVKAATTTSYDFGAESARRLPRCSGESLFARRRAKIDRLCRGARDQSYRDY